MVLPHRPDKNFAQQRQSHLKPFDGKISASGKGAG
jgi:hypothetical protein